jgi:hypothetical protein
MTARFCKTRVAIKASKGAYTIAFRPTHSVLDGTTVWLEYDAKDVASEDTAVKVTTPDAKTITATFDLKKLR